MVKLNYKDVTPEVCQALIFEILSERQRETFLEDWELDCSYSLEGIGRFRVNVFRQRKGVGAVFRLIPDEIQSIEELGLPVQIEDLVNVSEGLVLVTGPTGSGKSTTLASLIHSINMNQRAHIITIEDPIEFVHQNGLSLINQREVSSHTKSFHEALRAALREDPDIILVGEMRDLETISLALTAAETGHLVLATLHTNSATKTVDRIIDVFPDNQQAQIRAMLSETLRGVVAQSLIRRSDKQGRVPVAEVLINTPAVANLIREGKTFQIHSSMQTGQVHGMLTFEAAINDLVRRGVISRQEANTFLDRRTAGRTSASLHRPALSVQSTVSV
jgi:twitching motility protein PilT